MAGPILCPFCDEPTLPNILADGCVVCSCAAERDLGIVPMTERPPRAGSGSTPGADAKKRSDQRSVPQGAAYQPKPSPSAATWPRPGKAK
jgi:hypothetical protein